MRAFGRGSVVLIAGLLIGLVGSGCCVAQEPTTVSKVPDAAQKAFDEGTQYEDKSELPAAADSYRTALKAANGKCVACVEAVARVQMELEDYKGSAATEAQLVAQAGDRRAKAEAEMREGIAFFELSLAQSAGQGAIQKNAKQADASMQKAEALMAQGAGDDPTDETVRMWHARVLAAMKRDDQARSEFAACAAMPGTSPAECARALRFSKDVTRARGEPAPTFVAKTMDGQTVSLDSLAGKVVLVDFWATWCTYCRRDGDYVQSLLDSFDKEHFVLLEVDVDKDLEAWKNYVKEQRMEGVQVHDEGRALQDLFHVAGYPTYVIFDGDGVVQLREVGAKGDLRGTVRRLLEGTPGAVVASN